MTDASISQRAAQYQSQSERITDPGQILTLLRRASDARDLLTIVLADSPRPYNSAILKVDPEEGCLLLDELNPPDGHQRLVQTRQLRASCRIRGIELSFQATVTEVGGEAGIAFYRVALPPVLQYHQRRADYRVQVGRGLAIPVYLTIESEGTLEGQLSDLSAGGLSMRLETRRSLERGQRIEQCAIPLPKGEQIRSALEIRYARPEENPKWLRTGARFLNLTRAQQSRIQRFVAQLERELIRKLPRQ
ncbi:MAG TPA: flagellar regulator YcgR PilZN domain-containing protein [Gammaproteobacteria bacterium]|nr:flagellar regulator YcgR PilZN domain-containing protein [Gammaproteobacteria bacterium]